MALYSVCKLNCFLAAMLAFDAVVFKVALVNRIELSVNVGLLEAPHYDWNSIGQRGVETMPLF